MQSGFGIDKGIHFAGGAQFLKFLLGLAQFFFLSRSFFLKLRAMGVQNLLRAKLGAQKVLDAHRAQFQKEASAEEKELRQAEQELQKLRAAGKMDAFVDAEAALQSRLLTVERHVQARRTALDQAYADSMDKVRQGLVASAETLAKKAKINLVLVKQQVIWNDQVVDITDEVLSLLNKNLPNVEIKIEPQDDLWKDPRMPAEK